MPDRPRPDRQLRPAALVFPLAALAEIAGCFAVWAWWRSGAPTLWLLPGLASLALFAWLLALAPAAFAGRAYAAYGGVYVAASLVWLWAVEGRRPDAWDASGAAVVLVGGHDPLRSARRLRLRSEQPRKSAFSTSCRPVPKLPDDPASLSREAIRWMTGSTG